MTRRLQGAERRARRLVQGHAAWLAVLRLVEHDVRVESQIRVELDPLPREIQNLALPHAGVDHRHDHAAEVLVARRRTGGQKLLDLVFRKIPCAPPRRRRQFDLWHPVQVVPLPMRQPQHVAQDGQFIADRPGADGLDSLLLIGRDLLRGQLMNQQTGPAGREQLLLQNAFVLMRGRLP